MEKKCLPIVYYAIEVCPLNKAHISSLDFAVGSCFSKIFCVKSREAIAECMQLFNCQSTLLRKDGKSVYRNILRIETDFVNCSGKYLLNVGPCLRGCVENAANDWFVCLYLFQRISIMLQRFNSVLLHDTLPVDLPDLYDHPTFSF